MITMTLYTGNGISLSPQNAEGRHVSDYVRLVAEDGKGITDGSLVTVCADVRLSDVSMWRDCDAPSYDEDATAEDYEDALGRFGV